ncbi:MAG: M20/M25/M40 family metallo-hydrolase [Treponema sp.]|jgi:acetylornithine deacetylase/succinyl-diaminopimelate desuccinylase-like protein|nr:M20/M25/M40 family metallo-hydrolase [Treponema sp.]
MKIDDSAEGFIREHEGEALKLLETLAKIPAPSNHEEKRAAFVRDWLAAQGAEGVFIDKACNVIYPISRAGSGRLDVFMAHMDVVFPDTEELPVRIEGGKIMAPGIGDDTANLAALLLAAKYLALKKIKPPEGKGLLLVANSGEEGLGNLRGSRQICLDYGERIGEFVSFDGTFDEICYKAVGSRRYRVKVLTEGGHSYMDFGNRNAIMYLASMIGAFYSLKVPQTGRTTYNVGTIQGGTSVNTIAQSAEMLYEFRSDSRQDLLFMENHFDTVIAAYRAMGLAVEAVLVGERPCSGDIDPEKHQALLKRGLDAIKRHTGIDAALKSGSTDANIPLSRGIPAITLGLYRGKGAHTYEEWVDIESLKAGYRIAFELILDKFL